MLAAERVLLYSLAVGLGALLVREISQPDQAPTPPVAPVVASPRETPVEKPLEMSPSALDLADQNGQSRLKFGLDDDGVPRLIMLDAQGQHGLELSLTGEGNSLLRLSRKGSQLQLGIDSLGTVFCRLGSGESRQQMTVQSSGAAEWRLSGKATDPEAIVRLDPAGSVSWEFVQAGRSGKVSAALDRTGQAALQLIGDKKTFAQMFLAANGEVEIGVGGGPHGIEALMRTDQIGAAEVALSSPSHSGGPRLSMLPSGEMGVRILGVDGQSGPVMQMFKDGNAEITITDAKSQRGPAMFRGKDGASLIGIRGEKGSPGPRLYQGPKLESWIAIPGPAGSQAGWFTDPNTPVYLVITGADGKAVHLAPADAVPRLESKKSAP